MIPRTLRPLAGALLLALAAASTPARADDSAAAEALFQQAKTLADARDFAKACPKFEASYKLDKALGTLMNLADCEEHVDKIATAWAHWGEAVELTKKGGDKREAFATGRRDALSKRLPMIQIDVAAGKSALEVYRDGVKIDPAAYGVPLPSDPGPHTIAVKRGAEVLVEKPVVAKEADTVNLPLDLAAIEKAAPPPAPPPGAPQSSGQRTAGWVVGGVGVAALLAAGGLEIGALSAKSKANASDGCVNNLCTPQGLEAASRAKSLANAGQWVGIAGIAVAAVGLTLVLSAPSSKGAPPRPAAAMTLRGWATPGAGGISLGGAL